MSITQNFNGGDVADLADYSENGVGWSNFGTGQSQVSSGALTGVSGFAAYRCEYEIGSDDVEVQADYALNSGIPGLRARIHPTNDTGYVFLITSTLYRIQRFAPGSATTLETVTTTTATSGTAKITVVGDTITGYIDGVQVIQATDSTYTTGECGGIYLNGNATLDNFSAQAVSFKSIADASPMFAPLQDTDADTDVDVYVDGTLGTAASLVGGETCSTLTTTGPGSGFAAALDLDGAADYVTLASAVALTGPIGLCGWFNRDNTSSIHVLFGEAAAGATYVGLRNNTTTTLFRANGGAVVDSTHGTTSTNWHHYLFARDASDNLVLFVDGSQADSDAESGNDFTFDVLFRNTFGNYMDGQAAGVAAFDFDPSAVADLLYAGPPLTYSSGAALSADGSFDVGSYALPYGLTGTNGTASYTKRLRGPDGTVVETIAAGAATTGSFSDTLYNLGGEGKYRLEVLTSNDGGSVGWEQVASYEARTYETLTTLDLNILVISNNSTAANLINFLEADGHTCTKISDTGSALDDIDGMNLVVIDRDLAAPHGTNLGWLKDADIPIISLCAYLNDALALSTAAAAAFGAYSTFTVADENPLQPGLETGDVVTHGGTFDEWPQSLISGTTLLGYNTSVSARKTIGLMRAGLTNTDTNLTPNTRLVFPSKNAVSMNPTTHLGEVMAEALRLGVYWAIDPDVFEAGPSAGGDVLAGSLVESLVGSLVGPIVN